MWRRFDAVARPGSRRASALVAASFLLAATACGGGERAAGQPSTFDREGFEIAFEYPRAFEDADDLTVGGESGRQAAATAAIGIGERDVIAIQRYDLPIAVTASNLGLVKTEFDANLSRLVGRAVSGRRVGFGGLPGYEYRVALERTPGGRSRIVVLFAGRTEYLVNCQSTPEHRAEVEDACRMVLRTLRRA